VLWNAGNSGDKKDLSKASNEKVKRWKNRNLGKTDSDLDGDRLLLEKTDGVKGSFQKVMCGRFSRSLQDTP